MDPQNKPTSDLDKLLPIAHVEHKEIFNAGKFAKFITAVIAVLIIITSAITVFMVSSLKTKINQKSQVKLAKKTAIPSPTPVDETANWKIYTNKKFGFELQYPKFGQIIDNGTLTKDQRECGNAIEETTEIKEGTFPLELKEPHALEQVEIDNLHLINIYSWNRTIQDFINLNKAQGIWEWKSVKIENADEAVMKGDRISDTSFTPMEYVFGLFKRNNYLVLFANTQNPGNYGGCVFSNTKQPFEQKFKFTQ